MNRRTVAARLAGAFVALALLASALACNDAGAPQPARPPTSPPSSDWYRLYFTGPTPDRSTGGIPDALAASFDAAQTTIDVAIFQLDLPVIADALIRAKARGVRVRLVTDTESLDMPFIQDLEQAKIRVVDDRHDGLMHNKFAVIDGVTVWTGSMNFTESEAYRNNNNYLEIRSAELAENYTREFEEMFVRYEFGLDSTADTPHPLVKMNGAWIENYFAPEDKVAARILELIRSAKTSIVFMAFSFTRADFAEALIEQAQAGVAVQGVIEKRQIESGAGSAWDPLTQAGLDVRRDGNRYNQHHKVFLIDQEIVITGSYNFTVSAEKRNDENVLIIHDPDIARAYWAEWQKVWMAAPK